MPLSSSASASLRNSSGNSVGTAYDNAPITWLNIFNVLAYILNTVVVFGLGVFGGALGLESNAEVSAKYQTLITPAGWAFSIWLVIYMAQLFWAVLQLIRPRYRLKAVQQVSYYYILVCLAQVGWTVAFTLDIIWLSMVFMTLLLGFLVALVLLSRRRTKLAADTWLEEYFVLEFPFTIHVGWVLAAAIVNLNVVFVAYQLLSSYAEFFVALFSLVLILVGSSIFLALPDFTVPLVSIWALTGVYVELRHPTEALSNRFANNSVQVVRQAAGLAIIALLVAVVIRCYTAWAQYSAQPSNNSLVEPLYNNNKNNNNKNKNASANQSITTSSTTVAI